jgi:hypothetical protein
MKKVILHCLMIFGVLSSFAQTPLPNSGFENWSMHNGRLVPDYWMGRDTSATRTTDKYAGTYAVRIQNVVLPGDTIKGQVGSLPPDSSEGFQPAFPISVRHATLNGYYKFTPANGDSCQLIAFIYKHGFVNLPSFNLLGGGWMCKGTTPTYTPFTLYINYFDSTGTIIPDSCFINFSAFKTVNFTTGAELSPLGNSVLFVDNVSFDGFILGVNNLPEMIQDVNIYPNPSSAFLHIEMVLKESDYKIDLYDLNGKLVKSIASEKLSGHQNLSVNIKDIAVGDYILMISNKDGYCNRNVTIIK